MSLFLFLISLSSYQLPLPASAGGSAQCVITSLAGKVTILREGAKADVPAKAGDFLYEGDSIVTGPESLAAVALTGGAEVRINANTTFRMAGQPQGSYQKTQMNRGQVWSRLLHGKAEIQVQTPHAVAAVRGTEADIREGDVMTVKVYDGTVDLINAFGKTTLQKGQMSSVKGAEAAPEPPKTMTGTDAETWHNAIQPSEAGKEELLKKLQEESGKPREKTLKLKIEKDGEQKTLRIKFKREGQ